MLFNKIKRLFTLILVLTLSVTAYGGESYAAAFEEFYTPSPAGLICGLTTASDGSMWFIKSHYSQSQIVKLSINGQMTEYTIPLVNDSRKNPHTCSSSPGLDGGAWFISNEDDYSNNERSSYIRRISSNGSISTIPFTIPEPSVNNESSLGLTNIRFIDENNIWLTVGHTGESPRTYSMILKVNSNGNILYQQEQTEENPSFDITTDSNNNTFFLTENQLIKVPASGISKKIQLDEQAWIQASEFLGWGLRSRLNVDQSNNIWFYSVNINTPQFMITKYSPSDQLENYPLLEGIFPQTQLLSGQSGKVWFIAGNANNLQFTEHKLYSINNAGTIQEHQTLELAKEDIITSSTIGADGNLWMLVSNFSTEPNDIRVVKVTLDKLENPIITPIPPKSGNTEIFTVITSLVLISSLLFSIFIHKRHINNTKSIK